MSHPLASPFVRDQLSARAHRLNDAPVTRTGEFVLYWMQSNRRIDENWALRHAIVEADRLGRPVVILHELSSGCGSERLADGIVRPTARHWHFILDGTPELATAAESLGIPYLFVLHRDRANFVVGAVAPRACLVVTDDNPTGGSRRRAEQLAALAPCSVVAVESSCIVPASLFPREEKVPRAFRPRVMALVEHALEPVESRGPRHPAPAALTASLLSAFTTAPLPVEKLTASERAAHVDAASIDQAVRPVANAAGGQAMGLTRLRHFLDCGLTGYAVRREDRFARAASSHLSPYLRWGQIASATIAREVRAQAGAAPADLSAFFDALIVARELAYNNCLHTPAFTSLASLPAWAHRSMHANGHTPRPHLATPAQLDEGTTGLTLWDAAQRELRETGALPQHVRRLWGKSLILMTPTYDEAHRTLLRLNTRYALDGGDASGYASALACFGKHDRPYPSRPVWGQIRPMILERHARTISGQSYLAGIGA